MRRDPRQRAWAAALWLAAGALAAVVPGPLAATEVSFVAPGAPDRVLDRLRAASLVAATAAEGVDDPEELVAAAQADYARLLGALYAEGYFGGVITIRIDGREAAGIAPFAAPGRIADVVVRIEPGPRFDFSRAEVAPLAPGTELPAGFAPGQPALTGVMQEAVAAAIDGWRAAGRPKTDAAGQQITADHRSATVAARFAIAPGSIARFAPLQVTGTTRVRLRRIRDIAGLPAGEVFSPEAVQRAAERLRRTGTFSAVALTEAERVNPDGTIDILATIADAPLRRLGFGAEYSTGDGLKLGGYWLHRNLRGGAERLRFDAEIAGIGGSTGGEDYKLKMRATRPATFSPDTSVSIEAEVQRLDEPDYLSDSARLLLEADHVFSPDLQASLGLEASYFDVTDDFGRREFRLVSFPGSVTWDKRDDRLNPARGFFLKAGLRPFTEVDTGFGTRATLDARAYRGLGADDRVVLAGRFQLGSVSGPTLAQTPPDYLFFSGGGGTVRGQNYQSLGVDLGGGLRSGGRSFAALSLEARTRVTDKIGIVAFADAGYVGPESFPDGSGDWHAGAGLGLRYDTVIGPIRADLATPVRGGNSGSVELYIGIGQAF
jgi:translocation and assembly module TamA